MNLNWLGITAVCIYVTVGTKPTVAGLLSDSLAILIFQYIAHEDLKPNVHNVAEHLLRFQANCLSAALKTCRLSTDQLLKPKQRSGQTYNCQYAI